MGGRGQSIGRQGRVAAAATSRGAAAPPPSEHTTCVVTRILLRATPPHSASAPAGRAARCAGLSLRPFVGNAPDRAAGVIGDEERAVLGHGERGRPAPY